ncbi:MAG TPA: DUF6314 family protein [Balneolales bacterium]|nr:DUF6314 family protein [Balneolales bacterium]
MIDSNLAYTWHRLSDITHIQFQAQSEYSTGWNGRGSGIVTVSYPDENVVIYDEQGHWKSPAGRSYVFKNTYRWTLASSGLRLEHLRMGVNHPVFLVELGSAGTNKWESRKPHVCGNDLYTGILTVQESQIDLTWSVRGPKKFEKLINIYS